MSTNEHRPPLYKLVDLVNAAPLPVDQRGRMNIELGISAERLSNLSPQREPGKVQAELDRVDGFLEGLHVNDRKPIVDALRTVADNMRADKIERSARV